MTNMTNTVCTCSWEGSRSRCDDRAARGIARLCAVSRGSARPDWRAELAALPADAISSARVQAGNKGAGVVASGACPFHVRAFVKGRGFVYVGSFGTYRAAAAALAEERARRGL